MDAYVILVEDAEPSAVRWSVVANVVRTRPYGPLENDETRVGLKMFTPGARLHVIDGFGGMGWDILNVIGRPRRSGRYVYASVPTEHLENWRVTLVHSPAVLRLIEKHLGSYAQGLWARDFEDLTSDELRDKLIEVAASFDKSSAERRAARLAGHPW